MANQQEALPKLGLIGLGAMGQGMANRLLQAGHKLVVYDLNQEAVSKCVSNGANAANNAEDVVNSSEIVLTSLPSSDVFVQVAETQLLPSVRQGQVFIDLGTVKVKEARRLAVEFAERQATLLDAPVSGGPGGAATGTLRIFVGGHEAALARCKDILEVLGDPEHIVYCGPSGSGQLVKGVNQLAMGLGNAAYLEALAFGVTGGVDPEVIRKAVGGPSGWRKQLADIASMLIEKRGVEVGVKFGQLAYFLEEARAQEVTLPLSQALHDFCEPGDRVVMEANRLSPSFWRELTIVSEREAG